MGDKSPKGLMNRSQQDKVSEQRALPVEVLAESQVTTSVSAETVQLYYYEGTNVLTIDAGQLAGVAVEGKTEGACILDQIGGAVGVLRNSSLSFTSTAFTEQVAFPYLVAEVYDQSSGREKLNAITQNFTNGQYCVDHRTGIIYGKKADASVTLTSTAYKIASQVTGGGTVVTPNVNVATLAGVAPALNAGAVSAGTQRVVEALPGTGYYATGDTSFIAGDSPVTLDINASLSRNAVLGYLTCDGSGNILVEISEDGTTFGTQFTMKSGDSFSLGQLNIDKLRIAHSGTDSSYRVFAK